MIGAARRTRLLALACLSALVLALAAAPGPVSAQATDEGPPSDGQRLFVDSCASCHGRDGSGGDSGPDLTDVGAASADFQLRTGRMPLADPDAQAVRKRPAFSPEEIASLVAFVGSLGDGPEIPDIALDPSGLSSGQELFVDNCAACHGATANGGAAGPGALAPSLHRAEPLDVAEAVLTGPGEMPRFNFSSEELGDIASFVAHLQAQDAPGGADIGGIGPVPEGFVAWALGITVLLGACWLLGRSWKVVDR